MARNFREDNLDALIINERCFHIPYGDEDVDAEVHHLQQYPSANNSIYIAQSCCQRDSHRKKRKHRKHKSKSQQGTSREGEEGNELNNGYEHVYSRQISTESRVSADGRDLTITQRDASNARITEILQNEDKKAHTIFCEMDELRRDEISGVCTFHETARWLKFEEDVEEEGQRWSKPYVASLPLYFLFQVRDCFTNRTVFCLDIEVNNRAGILKHILSDLCQDQLIPFEKKEEVFLTMMSQVIHLHEVTRQRNGIPLFKRTFSEIANNNRKVNVNGNLGSRGSEHNLLDGNVTNGVIHKQNTHFRKKIPADAEASNVMLATMDFISEPVVGIARLKKSIHLEDVTEVSVPTRFMVIILGSINYKNELHEIGRCISTLMADNIFQEVAYKALDKSDFLAGFDGFLDEVTVLPPTEWDPKIKIEPPNSVRDPETRRQSVKTGNFKKLLLNIDEENECGYPDAGLCRTNRIFGGFLNDVKRRKGHYLSDFKDGLHIQCIGSLFFMYFACLTPIVTFGGLFGDATDENLGVMESILGATICGIAYHVFSGQPLIILGATGPILVYETISYQLCDEWNWNYLSFRFWIGLWCCAIIIVIVAFDLSFLVRYITRFTEESFTFLIGAIFIVEAFRNIYNIKYKFPVNFHPNWQHPPDYSCHCLPPSNNSFNNITDKNITDDYFYVSNSTTNNNLYVNYSQLNYKNCLRMNGTAIGSGCGATVYKDNIYFLSIILFAGTFIVAKCCKSFKSTRFFPERVRVIISDFSIFIAIVVFCIVDYILDLPTPKLIVPDKFRPTREDRSWIIPPFNDNPKWTCIAALGPAIVATILIFMDQQITAIIVNRKEHTLVKGSAYHLDLLIVGLLIGLCSILGLPWFVAEAVLSINHVRSLSKFSKCSIPGEKPKFLGVREQRVTGILVFVLISQSIFMTPLLKHVPMPVLYGVFLFMGISSLRGLQIVQRILIFFMPKKYQPNHPYLRHVQLKRVHLFTLIQVTIN
ncbi:DgyrCDS4706 [Dimorphilus gyrociliatus]|uniref:Anion exchange protein n=1 Tax=Dimorphilus gyrociliatus TaxID=2664684 RepID=A0A7I8VHU2_9ANNE|nr:DgyrCDS4706 [Dimorphilus gyrociliatus]